MLCIIRDLVDSQTAGRKQSVNLPASTSLNNAAKEIAKICGYAQGSVSVHYERQQGQSSADVSSRLAYLYYIAVSDYCCNVLKWTDISHVSSYGIVSNRDVLVTTFLRI